jgi:hypothetical protein
VAAQVDEGHRGVTEGQHVTVPDQAADRDRQPVRVGRVRHYLRAGVLLYLSQRLPVIAVLVGRHDPADRRVTDQLDQPARLVCRVDQDGLAGAGAAEQVGIVVHGAHGYLGHRQAIYLTSVGRTTDAYVSRVSHL